MVTMPSEEINLVKEIEREALQKTVDNAIRYPSMGILFNQSILIKIDFSNTGN